MKLINEAKLSSQNAVISSKIIVKNNIDIVILMITSLSPISDVTVYDIFEPGCPGTLSFLELPSK